MAAAAQRTDAEAAGGEAQHPRAECVWPPSACKTACGATLLVLGVAVAVVFGFVVPGLVSARIQRGLEEQYVPDEGSQKFLDWQFNDNSTDDPTEFFIVWLFNITNPDGILLRGERAVVAEVGPFVYQYHQHYLQPKISNGTITFHERDFYTIWRRQVVFENPSGPPDVLNPLDPDAVNITQLNAPLFAAAHQLRWNPFHMTGLQQVLQGLCGRHQLDELNCFQIAAELKGTSLKDILSGPLNGVFSSRPASAWIGLERNKTLNSSILEFTNSVQGLQDPDNRFGFFYNASQESDEEAMEKIKPTTLFWDRSDLSRAQSYKAWSAYEVLPGVQRTQTVSNISILNYEQPFAGWGEDLVITGALTSEFTHPGVDPSEEFNFWLSPAVRTVHFTYSETITLRGVTAYRYRVALSNLAASEFNAQMYFSPYEGLSNQSSARSFAPVFGSNPHFSSYTDVLQRFPVINVSAPDPHWDETFVDVEPVSGLVIGAAERLQIQLLMPTYNWTSAGFPEFNISANLLVPILHFSKRSQINSHDANTLDELTTALRVRLASQVVGGLLGGLAILGGIALVFVGRGGVTPHTFVRSREDYLPVG